MTRAELEAQGYTYDHVKRMYSQLRSKCHNGTITQKMVYRGKIIDQKRFRSLATEGDPNKNSNKQLEVIFRSYCDRCNKPAIKVWSFKHVKCDFTDAE